MLCSKPSAAEVLPPWPFSLHIQVIAVDVCVDIVLNMCGHYEWCCHCSNSVFVFVCICWYYFEDMWPRWVMLTIVIAIHWFLSRFSWAEQRNQGVQEPPLMLSRYYPPPSPLLPPSFLPHYIPPNWSQVPWGIWWWICDKFGDKFSY